MAGRSLKSRIEALEETVRPFAGYASVAVFEGQTVEQAKAAWELQNGAIEDRQVILWNFGGLYHAVG